VVRLLASVPSVIYGLAGVLVLVPLIGNHLITQSEKTSVTPIITLITLTGGLRAGVVVLTVMIAPIMIAVFLDGLRAVPRGWLEGSLAHGVDQWRTFWKVGVRTVRPVLVADTVLATARALGEAVMLSLVVKFGASRDTPSASAERRHELVGGVASGTILACRPGAPGRTPA
jgi:phosphate transport system permease protein